VKKDDPSNLSLELFVVLSRAYKSMMDYAVRDIRQYDLNPTEFAVLELLYHKGPQPLQQIGYRILLASGSITYVVDKLEKKGLLIRKPCTDDRRIIYALISESGREWMDQIFPFHKKAIDAAMASLKEEEKETVIQLLKKLGMTAQEKLT
jgi:MarR family 2-MHQ and catechol resistance regulon transcriptional repressor